MATTPAEGAVVAGECNAWRAKWSKTPRKAARVLPVPVADDSSTLRPESTCGRVASWAAVGSAKRRLNQRPRIGWRPASTACGVAAATGLGERDVTEVAERFLLRTLNVSSLASIAEVTESTMRAYV